MKYLFILLFLLLEVYSYSQVDNNIKKRIGLAPKSGAFSMEGYWVWGSSVIQGEDGIYHMYAARWPKHLTFHPGWMIQSDIVHCISPTPEGPYKFNDVALPIRGAQFWDGRSVFNPKICKYKDTYILFYTGSTHPFADFPEQDSLQLNSKYSIVGRSNKRIGVAWSKDPDGPWNRLNEPVLNTRPNTFYSFLTSNAAPWINKDGSVVMIFKSREYNKQYPYHSDMRIGVAIAPEFKGPYQVVTNKPIFGYGDMPEIEDPTLWKDDDGYHILAKDQRGVITGHVGHGIIAHSEDGISWHLDKESYAYSKTINWDDGTSSEMGQLERVAVLLNANGKISHLFFATMDGPGGFNNSSQAWNIVVPLK
ncbi:glycoside hydrolase family protein [uncultured Draconibacterium sp.]|uniref:glycoside hydrolase family protein n=1 Tax=uncultured Draconibacterium sp. TaxID=1573823 RepID=UPI002AA6236B|nr:glycoside hydrolase family protein [uncultured Draconibacterium sp.]